MAFIDDIRGFETSFLQSMHMWLEQVRIRARKRREFKRTYRELAMLTDHELADIGIARCDIARIARTSVDAD